MGLVTVYWPLTMNAAGDTALHAAGRLRFVDDCRENPPWFVGHVTTTLVPATLMLEMVGDGGGTIISTGTLDRL